MEKKRLHPTIIKFKQFVKNHPQLIKEVRSGKSTWQELYEEWYLLGEDDPRWESSHSSENDTKEKEMELKLDFIKPLMEKIKNIDLDQVQNLIGSLNDALGTLQGLIQQGNQLQDKPHETKAHPFSFRQD